MSEFEALNLMYLGFTFNALYTLGFILFTWLGFRMARNIYGNKKFHKGVHRGRQTYFE